MNHAVTNLYPKPVIFNGAGVSGSNVTVSTTAALLSTGYTNVASPLGDPTRYVTWQVQGGTIYITGDGSTPTASNGFALGPSTANTWSLAYFLKVKAVTSTATAVFRYEPLSD